MENTYKISVIVPVYNKEAYLERCLESLVHQTCQSFEIVPVDDGSTDKSGEICDHYAKEYPFVKPFHKENGGLVSAWKAGVAASTGEYLCFVDSDDWVDVQMLEELAEHLTGSSREMILSDYIIERSGKHGSSQEFIFQTLAPGEYDRRAIQSEIIPKLLGYEHRLITLSRCMKLFSRSLIESNTVFCDESIRMAEDSMITIPAVLDAERIYSMDHRAYYHYDYVESSMVHRYDPTMYKNMKHLYQVLTQMLNAKLAGAEAEEMLRALDREYVFLLLLVLKNEARNEDASYREKIRRVCTDPDHKAIVHKTADTIRVKESANRLLYWVLRSPNFITIFLLRLAMKVYYA